MPKYLLQKSDKRPLCWVLTDTENQIVCRFIEGQFNETQQITLLEDPAPVWSWRCRASCEKWPSGLRKITMNKSKPHSNPLDAAYETALEFVKENGDYFQSAQ